MNIEQRLDEICGQHLGNIDLVRTFLREMRGFLKRKQHEARTQQLDKKGRRELSRFLAFLKPFVEKKKPHPARPVSMSIESEALGKLLLGFVVPLRHQELLAEMTLTHLVSQEEGFLKEYAFAILVFRREMLKSNKQLTYSEICDSESLDDLFQLMARKEVDALGHGGIDDFCKYFKDRLGADLAQFPQWGKIRESSYRRNLIVHNGGITNDAYCSKVAFRKRGTRLKTTPAYSARIAAAIAHFIEYIDTHSRRKFKIRRKRRV